MNKNKEELKEIIKTAINEGKTITNECLVESFTQLDKLVQVHQEVLTKINKSSNPPALLTAVLNEITSQLEQIEDDISEKISELHVQTLNENEYGEGWMIKSQLYNIAKNALRLHKIVNEKEDFEDWIQAKITVVDDYMSTIAQFIEYRKMTVGNFDMDDKDQYNELNDDDDLSKYNNDIPLI